LIALDPKLAARGYALHHVSEIGSTNLEAKAALREGADRLWIVADVQLAGRGRHERGWVSPKGNLYASIALREPAPLANLPLLGFVAGVALVEAILALAPDLAPRLALKWPNDLLLDGVKAAGILLEGDATPEGRAGLVIGMGVNIATIPEGLDRPAVALASAANWLTRDTLFASLQKTFAETLSIFDSGRGFAAIRAPMGQRLSVKLPTGLVEGAFAGLDAYGALRLETARGTETVLAGDVFVLD
jgi:BirA family transcriptional regulator, biotin operon repressor / biotin---[acetyl-CoA-carboxylase] ligase